MWVFNYSDICWKTYSAKNEQSNKFLTSLAEHFLFEKVEVEPVILDHILTNEEELIDEEKAVGTLGAHNHIFLWFTKWRGEAAALMQLCWWDLHFEAQHFLPLHSQNCHWHPLSVSWSSTNSQSIKGIRSNSQSISGPASYPPQVWSFLTIFAVFKSLF